MRRSTLVLVALMALIGALALAATASAGLSRTVLFTSLSGQEEVSDSGVPEQGDLDGHGLAIILINTDTDRICWKLFVFGIELPATAAHIHQAPAGVNGAIVVPLSPPTERLGLGRSAGCTFSPLADAIAGNPGSFYVNVHNTPFPAGAMRGQL